MGRCHARHATKQDAAAHLRLLEILRTLLDAHPPRHLAHRNQQRQSAAVVAERFIGHGGGTGGEKTLREPAVGGKVKVGEHRLAGADQLQLRGLRLLHLHDHVGPANHLLRRVDEFRPTRRIGLIGEARAGPCRPLHEHAMAGTHQLLHAHREHRHPILVLLRFLRDADDHAVRPPQAIL